MGEPLWTGSARLQPSHEYTALSRAISPDLAAINTHRLGHQELSTCSNVDRDQTARCQMRVSPGYRELGRRTGTQSVLTCRPGIVGGLSMRVKKALFTGAALLSVSVFAYL